MSYPHVPNCQIICRNMIQVTFQYFFHILLIAFLFSKGYFSKISTKFYNSISLLFTILLRVLVWLSKTCLDSTAPLDDRNLVISGYNLVRSLYYKNYLPLRALNVSYLKRCLNFELKIGDKSSLLPFIGPQVSLKTILKPSLITLKWR